MQINGIGLKEKLDMAQNGQAEIIGQAETPIFQAQYQSAVVLEKNKHQEKEYSETDISQKQLQEKSPVQLSRETIEKLADSVTPQDFSIYRELGLAPEADDPSTIVTVTERIKIELATHCEEYQMYGEVDMDTLKSIYGDSGIAYKIANSLQEHHLPVTQNNIEMVQSALDMAEKTGELSEDSMEYILDNQLPLSIETLYLSEYTESGSGTSGIKVSLTEEQWDSLRPQIESLFEKAGIHISQEKLTDARWMIEHRIPVTIENMQKLSVMKQYQNNRTTDEWIDSIVATLAYGGNGMDTLVVGSDTIEDAAEEFVTVINDVTNEELAQIIEKNNILNMNHFKQEKEKDNPTENSQEKEQEQDIRFIKARRQLEEIRLRMTVEAGVKMMMKGVDIATEPIEQIVDELKRQENEYAQAMFANIGYAPDEEEISQFRNITETVEALHYVPSYILGNVVSGETAFSVESLTEQGQELKLKLEAAGEAYETMRTQPRRDLGDHIKKAFDSVDGILKDLGMELTENSRRAVRILAYNQMDITRENVNTVKQLDMEVTRLMDNMTPKTVVHLIKEGINPLHTEIQELNDKLAELNTRIGAGPAEKYSEYLWKLQQDHEINEEERRTYIGIYRLLNLVAKGDYSVIGALVAEGADVTMNHMLRALRTEKAQGMDVRVDETMGLTEEVIPDDDSISSQLAGFTEQNEEQGVETKEQRYQQQLLQKALADITPQKLSKISEHGEIQNMTLEELVSYMGEEEERSQEYQMKYYEQQAAEMQQAVKNVSEDVFQMLLDSGQMASVENVMTAAFILSDHGKMFGRIKKISEEDKVSDKVEKISNFDGEKEELQQSYESLDHTMEEILNRYMMSGNTEQMEELIRLKKAVHMMNLAGRKEMYHVPVEIQGETTGVRVTIISDSSEKGKVTADIHSELFGKIAAEFRVMGNKVDGVIVADRDDTVEFLNHVLPDFEKALEEKGYTTEGMNSSKYEKTGYGMWSVERKNSEDSVSNASLYRVAKIFITNIKEWGKGVIINP